MSQELMDITKGTLELAAGVFVVETLLPTLGDSPGFVGRNIGRGVGYYLARELVEEATTRDSNFRKMTHPEGWINLIDDSFFFTLVAGSLEFTNVLQGPAQYLNSKVGDKISSDAVASLITGFTLEMVDKFVEKPLADTEVRHITRLVGWK